MFTPFVVTCIVIETPFPFFLRPQDGKQRIHAAALIEASSSTTDIVRATQVGCQQTHTHTI